MMETHLIYCDHCGLPIANYQPRFDHQELTLCSACALKLYQKIFDDSEAEEE